MSAPLLCGFCAKPAPKGGYMMQGLREGHTARAPLICDQCVDFSALVIGEYRARDAVRAAIRAERAEVTNPPPPGPEART